MNVNRSIIATTRAYTTKKFLKTLKSWSGASIGPHFMVSGLNLTVMVI